MDVIDENGRRLTARLLNTDGRGKSGRGMTAWSR